MSKIPVKNSTGEMPDIKPGVYEATCIRVKDDHLDNAQFGDGDVVRIFMQFDELYDSEGEQVVLDAIANRVISPKAKLTRWAEALGSPIDFDSLDEFETEQLLGGEALVKVVRKDAASWPRIDEITARPTKGAKPTPAKADGEPDFTAFWAQVKVLGKTKDDVQALLPNRNMLAMQDMSGADLVELLERLEA